eukprot:6005875-Pleurochrysis_carterae.AAC.1
MGSYTTVVPWEHTRGSAWYRAATARSDAANERGDTGEPAEGTEADGALAVAAGWPAVPAQREGGRHTELDTGGGEQVARGAPP